MNNPDHYNLMSDYNQWMNQALYQVCETIPDAKRKQDLGAFFKSLHSTLNHILWADEIWLGRFAGTIPDLPAIGQDLYADFNELKTARSETDNKIKQWLNGLDSGWLAGDFSFTSVSDHKTRSGPGWVFVSHMLNHQTHHRGQITTLISQLGFEPPVTDIPWMPGLIKVS